ncbi:MAG: NUDIX domain-containing protein [Actinomycetota bacterium]|nr:NUDIX domain-containing protein [Actinomycetota bacterium]
MTPDLATLQRAEAAEQRCVVGAVIVDDAQRALVLRRSPSARYLPGLWDIVGGHVEVGESLLQALRREVTEETGWKVLGEPSLVFVCDWQLAPDQPRRELDFVVSVAGDLASPRLSPTEHVHHRWITRQELGLFEENHGADEGLLRRIVDAAFGRCGTGRLDAPHATIFLGESEGDIEQLRRHWDPVMAAQIGAHVSVAYPTETPHLRELDERVRAAARMAAPFELELGAVVHGGDPGNGVFVQVHDPAGGWRKLRESSALGSKPVQLWIL